MLRHRFVLWACVSTAALVGLAVTIAAAEDPFHTAEKSATASGAQDPFQTAEKSTKGSAGKTDEKAAAKQDEPEFVRKTDEEWAKILSAPVFMVTRRKVTEPAFSGKYATGHYRGTFICACCEAELFRAQHKFDSGTGWPSFWRPVSDRAIQGAIDNSEAEQRIEVMCRRCGAHLGHVFNDNPAAPTGLRYCINSLALKLKPLGAESSAKPTAARSKAKAKTTTKPKTRARTVPQTTQGQGSSKTPAADRPDPGDEKLGGSQPPAPGN
jgi:peptide-methionine (R)-S-oxide reductase